MEKMHTIRARCARADRKCPEVPTVREATLPESLAALPVLDIHYKHGGCPVRVVVDGEEIYP